MLTHPIPVNVVTARLMSLRYVKALVSHQERELCLAGLWVITGFAQRPIAVQKGSRPTSSYTTRKRLSVFANAITSFSNRPLIYIFQIGMSVMALSAGEDVNMPPQGAPEVTAEQGAMGLNVAANLLAWPALKRKAYRLDPSFAT